MADLIRRLGLDTPMKKILATAAIAGAVYGGYRILTSASSKGKKDPEKKDSELNKSAPPKVSKLDDELKKQTLGKPKVIEQDTDQPMT